MKIEKIQKLKSGKYKIELDNNEKIITYDDVILSNNLLFNNELNSEVLNKLNIDTAYYDIYNKTIKYIITKLRSTFEIQNYLNKLNVDETDSKKIIDKLKEIGLINDFVFCKAYISDKINLSNIGPIQIKKDLINHEIDEGNINEILNSYDEEIYINKINKIISKKIKNSRYSNNILKQKLVSELMNLGYDYDMIKNCISNFSLEDSLSLKREFDKQYKLLSKKFKNEELLKQIKNKLYQKGYSISEINEAIEKG